MIAPQVDPQGFSQFAAHFFAGASAEDLALFSLEARASIARLFWNEAAERKPGTRFLKVFSPDGGTDGISPSLTLLVTVNDDKPFLVDSILSELNECGAKIRAVFHPIFRVRRQKDAFCGFVFDGSEAQPESMICVAINRTTSIRLPS